MTTEFFGLLEYTVDESGKPIAPTGKRRVDPLSQTRLADECDRDFREIENSNDDE